MPYSRNADLPAQVRNTLPPEAQSVFLKVVNAKLIGKATPESAHRQAWTVVGQQYTKPSNGGTLWVRKRQTSTLYVKRNVENALEIIKWAKEQGFEKTQLPSQMHVTVAHSKQVVDWPLDGEDDGIIVRAMHKRSIQPLGDNGAVVLKLHNAALTRRWQELCEAGCSWDHDDYTPHVTVTWNGGDADLSKMKPYTGDVVLGPEVFEEIKEGWRHSTTEKADIPVKICKVDLKLGLVFGWAIICKISGEPYFDLQDDHIPEEAMLEAAADFMERSRTMKLMHEGKKQGDIIFAWPLTTEISKAMGLESHITGLMIAAKPANKNILKAYQDGTLTGFSIGGQRLEDEDEDLDGDEA